MSSVDISQLSAAQLEKLIKDAQGQIESRKNEERNALRAQIEKLLADAGYKLSDLYPAKGNASNTPKARSPLSVKYEYENNNWTGKGPKPGWLKKFIEDGGNLESIQVKV